MSEPAKEYSGIKLLSRGYNINALRKYAERLNAFREELEFTDKPEPEKKMDSPVYVTTMMANASPANPMSLGDGDLKQKLREDKINASKSLNAFLDPTNELGLNKIKSFEPTHNVDDKQKGGAETDGIQQEDIEKADKEKEKAAIEKADKKDAIDKANVMEAYDNLYIFENNSISTTNILQHIANIEQDIGDPKTIKAYKKEHRQTLGKRTQNSKISFIRFYLNERIAYSMLLGRHKTFHMKMRKYTAYTEKFREWFVVNLRDQREKIIHELEELLSSTPSGGGKKGEKRGLKNVVGGAKSDDQSDDQSDEFRDDQSDIVHNDPTNDDIVTHLIRFFKKSLNNWSFAKEKELLDEFDNAFHKNLRENASSKLQKILKPFEAQLNEHRQTIESFEEIEKIKESLRKQVTTDFDKLQKAFIAKEKQHVLLQDYKILKRDDINQLIIDANKIKEKMKKFRTEALQLYSKTLEPINIILDDIFIFTYFMKILNYGIFFLAIYFATKIFNSAWEREVLIKQKDPPNLLKFYGIFLGINIGMNLFIITFFFLLLTFFKKIHLFSTSNSMFLLSFAFTSPMEIIMTYVKDYVFYILVTSALLIVVGHVMQKKKYFVYKTTGRITINAYKDIITYVSVILMAFPYFLAI